MGLVLGRVRQGAADLRHAAEHVQFRLDHIRPPREEDIDFRRAATGGGPDIHRTGDVVHGFFNGPCDRGHHFIGRHDAVVHENDHAREVGFRKDGSRHMLGGVQAGQTQDKRGKQDDFAVAGGKPFPLRFITRGVMVDGRF